jgi:hypothetical protein
MMDEGYWTFKQLRKKMEENGLTFKEYPDGRVKIDLDSGKKNGGTSKSHGDFGIPILQRSYIHPTHQ